MKKNRGTLPIPLENEFELRHWNGRCENWRIYDLGRNHRELNKKKWISFPNFLRCHFLFANDGFSMSYMFRLVCGQTARPVNVSGAYENKTRLPNVQLSFLELPRWPFNAFRVGRTEINPFRPIFMSLVFPWLGAYKSAVSARTSRRSQNARTAI